MFKKILFFATLFISTVKIGISQIKIIGTINSSESKKKLKDIKIKVKGTDIETSVDSSGSFQIDVPNYEAELEIFADDEIFLVQNFYNDFNIEIKKNTFYLNYLDYLDYQNYQNYQNYYNYQNYSDYSNYFDYQNYYNFYSDYYAGDYYTNYYDYYYSDYYNYSEVTDYSTAETESIESDQKSGLLTAGEINDFGKWEMWEDIAEVSLVKYQNQWAFAPLNRYCVQIDDENEIPVINAKVYLIDNNNDTIWSAISDNSGKAELWGNLFKEQTEPDLKYKIVIHYQGKDYKIKYPKMFHHGINFITVKSVCQSPRNVDIAFVVDATGSMSDEITYLQTDLLDIIGKIENQHKDLTINTGSVFYRDNGDDYLTKYSNLTPKIEETLEFINKQKAAGGGDFPEAVDMGLQTAIQQISWNENAVAKVIFLILDAPPHFTDSTRTNIQNLTLEAASRGIRIVPVTCSGIDKNTEYLMRAMALATNGTYVFLTDDSGIGYKHLKPSTDEYDVETFNELIIRLVNQYTIKPDCDNVLIYDKEEIKDSTLIFETEIISEIVNNENFEKEIENKLLIYPNPTTGNLKIELNFDISELYLADISGKILKKIDIENKHYTEINISDFPSGIYFIQYFSNNERKSAKIILLK